MFKTRTDLAMEIRESAIKRGVDDGILFSEETLGGVRINTVEITTEKAADNIGRPRGTYITAELGKIWLRGHAEFIAAVDAIALKLSTLAGIGRYRNILVAGLGNAGITADSLGPRVLDNIIVTRHLKEHMPALYEDFGMVEMSAIAPGVLGRTGMESAFVIQGIAHQIKPDLVVLIDSLASRKITRLAATVQLSDTGISPGSGVGNHRKAIDRELLGADVISIGVPMVVDAATLAYDVLEDVCERGGLPMSEQITRSVLKEILDDTDSNFFVTPKECDVIAGELAKLLGYAINRTFYDNVSYEEMARMV